MVQQAVRSEIEETNSRFTKALGEGDVATVASLYTADAVLAAPNAPMVRGTSAIKELLGGMVQQMGAPDLKLETQEVEELGDTAWELGTYRMKAAGNTDTGKYIVIWKRQGGVWKLHADIWNSDSPPPSA
jgi:ketosteroid isomerase-like protein